MKTLFTTLPLAALLFTSGAAFASDTALAACRAIGDVAARVACYDAIPLGAAAAAKSEGSFGVEAVKASEAQPRSIQSTVVGEFSGWSPGSQIRLANGQVWRISDGSEAVLAPTRQAKVTIERNLLGTLFLRVEGSNTSAKVRRVQ